ncbi:dipeptidase E [Enterococcus sp. DIV0840]|uniref:Type 1 glutamine amidotransferase-like domain-containing protein n=1 Tax=Enterococcus TaxID=1350 RepID=UPI001A8CED9E|nr:MULTISPECIES: Type 1 glutamine amidotransferase-like domain-containing protein [Enterococcus]MBO0433903.1 Type 1 glutamine amidotransferase-like domain-containing protein [Enterococcus sp. DIV0849a]MBO0475097.1 Type 1 glutamine amidotransferase-like domain-containing protein [Enterococcus ureasiticus]
MKKLFLTSSFKDSYMYLADFVEESLLNRTVTFINTASKVEEYTQYIDDALETFKTLGLKVEIIDIATRNYLEIEKSIRNNSYIYVGGGNTFYLLQEMKRKNIDILIKSEIKNGKVYIGESAGSVIVSPHIEYISKADDKEKAPLLNDYKGLGEIDVYPLPHYNSSYFGEVMDEIYNDNKNKLQLIPIRDQQAILFKNNRHTIMG